MKYKILNSDNPVVLEQAVSAFLSEGWEPQGGVSVARVEYEFLNAREGIKEVESSTTFAQALIKRESADTAPH